jgi:hypothetical protein
MSNKIRVGFFAIPTPRDRFPKDWGTLFLLNRSLLFTVRDATDQVNQSIITILKSFQSDELPGDLKSEIIEIESGNQ